MMDDIDFKAKVSRAEFEELCADLFERVPGPVQDALTAAEMKLVSILLLSSELHKIHEKDPENNSRSHTSRSS